MQYQILDDLDQYREEQEPKCDSIEILEEDYNNWAAILEEIKQYKHIHLFNGDITDVSPDLFSGLKLYATAFNTQTISSDLKQWHMDHFGKEFVDFGEDMGTIVMHLKKQSGCHYNMPYTTHLHKVLYKIALAEKRSSEYKHKYGTPEELATTLEAALQKKVDIISKQIRTNDEVMEAFNAYDQYGDGRDLIKIWNMCYQTCPCQHRVQFIGPTEIIETRRMSAQDIAELFRERNMEIPDHFKYERDERGYWRKA